MYEIDRTYMTLCGVVDDRIYTSLRTISKQIGSGAQKKMAITSKIYCKVQVRTSVGERDNSAYLELDGFGIRFLEQSCQVN